MSTQQLRTHEDEGDALVEVRNLKKYYESGGLLGDEPVKAVDGVDFEIRRGETLGLVGESGCGKTTLGRTLVQLETATAGEVRFDGRDVTTLAGGELKDWRRNAQMVFQDPESSLNERMTVGEIVREPLDVHDWPEFTAVVEGRDDVDVGGDAAAPSDDDRNPDFVVTPGGSEASVEVRERLPLTADDVSASIDGGTATVSVEKSKGKIRRQHVRGLLDVVGLQEEHYYRYPHQFSGGQRQRVGIARALALEPEFVVLDEPVSALDVSVQAQVLNLLEDLQDEFGLTYLFIAHDLSVVRHICDRVAVMYLGNVMELGETEELFAEPANPYTISLLSAIPEPDPTMDREQITLRGTPPSPRDPPTGCPFSTRCPMKIRPEEFRDLDDDLWRAIETFREVVRERTRADRSLREIAKEYLGLHTRFADTEEIVADVFGDLDAPPEVQRRVDEAADLLEDEQFEAARQHLFEAFGSACDRERPDYYETSASGRESLCHRHADGHADPRDIHDTQFDE